jgi:all-trans-retinol 13,14-reductase
MIVGGPRVIAEAVVPVIESFGGKVFVRSPVTSIIISDDKAVGVVCKGHELFAPMVISSIGAPLTFTKLVPESHRHLVQEQIAFMKRPEATPSLSLSSMFVGLEGIPDTIEIPRRNYWMFPTWNHNENMKEFIKDNDKMPAVFISFSSAKDPTYQDHHPGKHVALVIAPSLYETVAKYAKGRVKHRGDEYEQVKEKMKSILMDHFETQFPHLKQYVTYLDIGTAVTNDYYLGTNKGAVYGMSHTPERFKAPEIGPYTPIKNLYLTGQDVATSGICGALVGGALTASFVSVGGAARVIKAVCSF